MTTHSTAKVAAELAGDSMKDPEGWLLRKIRAGVIPARKVGRHYRMTDDDVAAALEILGNSRAKTTGEPEQDEQPVKPLSLTATSARRMQKAS